jgi:hypothetical protein
MGFSEGELGLTGRMVLLTVLVLVLVSPGITAAPPSIDGPAIGPSITITLEPPQLEAQLTDEQLGAVTFGGTVTVELPPIIKGTVTMQAVVNTGWPVVLSPQTVLFSGPGEEDFQVTVIVPPATSAQAEGVVTVTGSLKLPGLGPVVTSATAMVTIAQYYLTEIDSTEQKVRVHRGDEITLEGTINNGGNGPAIFMMSIVEEPSDVALTFAQRSFELQPDEFATFRIKANVGKGVRIGIHNIIVGVDCMDDENHSVVREDYLFLLDLRSVIVTPTFSIIIIAIVAVAIAAGFAARKGLLRLPRRRARARGSESEEAKEI